MRESCGTDKAFSVKLTIMKSVYLKAGPLSKIDNSFKAESTVYTVTHACLNVDDDEKFHGKICVIVIFA